MKLTRAIHRKFDHPRTARVINKRFEFSFARLLFDPTIETTDL